MFVFIPEQKASLLADNFVAGVSLLSIRPRVKSSTMRNLVGVRSRRMKRDEASPFLPFLDNSPPSLGDVSLFAPFELFRPHRGRSTFPFSR